MYIQSYLYIPKIYHILTDLIIRNDTITKPASLLYLSLYIYFLFIIWTCFGCRFFLQIKKICPNNKKEIYNDKYRRGQAKVLFKTDGKISSRSEDFLFVF